MVAGVFGNRMKIGNYWFLKPHDAFGNRAEDLYYGVLKCRRDGLRLIILKRKWNLFGKLSFRNANIAMLDIHHPIILSNFALAVLNIFLTLWWTTCRVFGFAFQKLYSLKGWGIRQNFLIRWSENQIGRDGLWGKVHWPFATTGCDIDWGREHRQFLGITFGSRAKLESSFPDLIDRPYICIHVRTGDFFGDHQRSAPRNAEIENYIPSIDELVNRGYIVVRMGDSAMPKLLREGVLDYAHHPLRNETNDILLIEHCEVYIGSLTGPIDLACLFEKRILTVNTLSLAHCTWYREGSLFIPKKVVFNGSMLSIKEQIDRHFFDIMGDGHTHPGVKYIENTSDEILAATHEFMGAHELKGSQIAFNDYLKKKLIGYFDQTSILDSPHTDAALKLRWLARHHTVNGAIADGWLEQNWK